MGASWIAGSGEDLWAVADPRYEGLALGVNAIGFEVPGAQRTGGHPFLPCFALPGAGVPLFLPPGRAAQDRPC